MLDLAVVRADPDAVRRAARDKGIAADVDAVLALDAERRDLLRSIETLRAERNEVSRSVARLTAADRPAAIARGAELKRELEALQPRLHQVETDLREQSLRLPAIPAADTPVGATEADNVELRRWGVPPPQAETALDHTAIGRKLGIIDSDAAVAFAGARAYFLCGAGALLEQALMRVAMERLLPNGFTLLQAPVLVRDEAMVATGYFPLGRDEVFRLERDSLNLIGTAEVPLIARYAGRTLGAEELPIRVCALTPCFRREVGAAGRETRGLYRVHQFMKVEQVAICAPDEAESARLHDELLGNAEGIMQALQLPYRVVRVCTGDMGQGQVKKHDIEAWMPSRAAYGETHSCSSFGDFQARRAGIRWGGEGARFCYTLNCTAIASPRALIPLLEVHQQPDGGVRLPEALWPHMPAQRIG